MDNANRTELNHIKGRYGQKYGHQIDDWSALFLSEVQEHFDKMEQNVDRSISTIDKAASVIKGKHRQIQFSDKLQAFYYALGGALPLSFAAIVMSVLIFWYASKQQAYQSRMRVIETYENAPDYILLMQNGKIVHEQGSSYLELKPRQRKGDVLIGKEYIYDAKNKRVLVPLGRN